MLLNFDLTEEQNLTRHAIREFAEKEIAPMAQDLDEREGDLMDIYTIPLDGQTIPGDSCPQRATEYINDLARNLEHTYTFLEKRFGIKEEEVKRRWEGHRLIM